MDHIEADITADLRATLARTGTPDERRAANIAALEDIQRQLEDIQRQLDAGEISEHDARIREREARRRTAALD